MSTRNALFAVFSIAIVGTGLLGCADDSTSDPGGDAIVTTSDVTSTTGGDTTTGTAADTSTSSDTTTLGDTSPDASPDAITGCVDTDNDGAGVGPTCPPSEIDCAPDDPAIYPGATELCNGIDDDCDDATDEDFDFMSDPANCGGCDAVCDASDGTPTCSGGVCGATCEAGRADCDGDPTDCEVITQSDPANCGGCGIECTLPDNSTDAVCAAGACALNGCEQPWFDCDGDFASGCEVNLDTVENCGACGNACDFGANTVATCGENGCELVGCATGFDDCNQDMSDGCEVNTAVDGDCSCVPNTQEPCYTADPNTLGRGLCAEGYRLCNATGTGYLPGCRDQVIPTQEICGNNIDEDCSGMPDDVADLDGDGYTRCDGDCCEDTMCASNPEFVNPGAIEVAGNMVDDDCNPATTDADPLPTCSSAAKFGNITPTDMAQAMDICKTASGPGDWGLVSAEFRRADGSTPSGTELSEISGSQTSVMTAFGTWSNGGDTGIQPRLGDTMAGISSGWMRDANDPGYPGEPSADFGNSGSPPASYLAANGGALPSAAGCSGTCDAGSGANDWVNLRLELRAPTNAQGFQYRFKFYSWEYWTYSCTEYNDFYLALLDSSASGIPSDGNISFDSMNNPVSVNNGFFEECAVKGCYTCPSGVAPLAGTGFDSTGGTPDIQGGATDWLVTTAPVVPGETFILELMIFDVSDNILDSAALLDGFEWLTTPTSVGTGED